MITSAPLRLSAGIGSPGWSSGACRWKKRRPHRRPPPAQSQTRLCCSRRAPPEAAVPWLPLPSTAQGLIAALCIAHYRLLRSPPLRQTVCPPRPLADFASLVCCPADAFFARPSCQRPPLLFCRIALLALLNCQGQDRVPRSRAQVGLLFLKWELRRSSPASNAFCSSSPTTSSTTPSSCPCP